MPLDQYFWNSRDRSSHQAASVVLPDPVPTSSGTVASAPSGEVVVIVAHSGQGLPVPTSSGGSANTVEENENMNARARIFRSFSMRDTSLKVCWDVHPTLSLCLHTLLSMELQPKKNRKSCHSSGLQRSNIICPERLFPAGYSGWLSPRNRTGRCRPGSTQPCSCGACPRYPSGSDGPCAPRCRFPCG